MLIAVNTRFLIKDKLEGIGWYTYEVFSRLTRSYPQHKFLFLFDREPDPTFIFNDNVIPVKVWPPARHPYLWQFWFDYSLPSVFKKYKPDLFISTDGFCSLKAHLPTLLVIHDLGFEHYPEHTPSLVNRYYRKYTPEYARHADRIITVSDFTRQDVIDRYGIDPDKVHRVYNGANQQYRKLGSSDQQQFREKYSGGSPFFIYVGSVHPRKNVSTLLKAFDLFRERHATGHKLVIAGRLAWKTDETRAVLENMKHREDVIITGHLLPDELQGLLGSAEALVYPSLFEGFGIPVVEARYAGIPVISSNRSCLPEVAGPNALMFDPESAEDICRAMEEYMERREHFRAAAASDQTVRSVFNWDKSAEETAEVIASMDKRFNSSSPRVIT